jgi:hypothetical protein
MADTYHDVVIIKVRANLDSTMGTRLFTDNPIASEWKQCSKVGAGSVPHQLPNCTMRPPTLPVAPSTTTEYCIRPRLHSVIAHRRI